MKKLVVLLMSAFMMTTVMPVYAAGDSGSKDECLLVMKSCANQVDSMQEKIKKINNEIKKGTKVYSPEELKKLNDKLKEANEMLDNLTKN